jgi:hypothetical protein
LSINSSCVIPSHKKTKKDDEYKWENDAGSYYYRGFRTIQKELKLIKLTIGKFNKPLEILQLPIPTPAPDQILVRVLASSLCNSDIAGWMGVVGAVTPYCGGHERKKNPENCNVSLFILMHE